MKGIQLLLICSLFQVITTKVIGQKTNDLSKENLKGKVKSVKVTTYLVTNESKEFGKREIQDSSVTKYNALGNRIEIRRYDINVDYFSKALVKYNSSNIKTETIYYNLSGNLEGRDSYKYDSVGNQVEIWTYTTYNSLLVKYFCKYDSKGNQIEISSDDGASGSTSFYDGNGNKIEDRVYEPESEIEYKWTYKYSRNGNITEQNYFISNQSKGEKYEEKHTYKYTLDKMGNWIKCIEYIKGKPSTIKERQIIYF